MPRVVGGGLVRSRILVLVRRSLSLLLVAALGATSWIVTDRPARVSAATGIYHAAPFLFDTNDYLLINNVGVSTPGIYHGPPYQFDTNDYLMVDCAIGCGGGGTVTSVTGTAPITSSGGSTPAIGCATCVTTAGGQSIAGTTSVGNLIDSGLSANDTCVASSGTKQLADPSSPCALVASANTFTASNIFNNLQNVNGTAGTCAGAPTTIYGLCLGEGNGTTNLIAVAIGWQTGTSNWSCVASCTTSNSAQLCFYNMGTGGPAAECMYRSQSTGSMVLGTGAGTALTLTGALSMGANSIASGGGNVTGASKVGTNASCSGTTPLTSPASNNLNCRITAASSSAVLTFGTAYAAAPVCVASDETTVTSAVKVAPTTTNVTLTTPGAADVVDVICTGNGGV